jgi:MFS family permease
MAGSATSLRILRQRNFALYFVGNLASNCGTWFQVIAQSLLIFRLTHSTLLVGVTNFAMFIGVVLLAPWAGSAADRYDRRKLLILTQVGATLVSAALAACVAVGLGSVIVVIGLAFLLGFSTAFATPAMQAIVPGLVSRADLGAAVSMNSVTFNLARAVGGVGGAFVVAKVGIAWAIGLNALSYVVFAVSLLFVEIESYRREQHHEQPRLLESIRSVRRNPHLGLLLIVVAAASFTMDPVSTVTPEFSTKVFHQSDVLTGYLIGAFGLGAVIASLVPNTHPKDRTISAMFVLFGAGMLAFALSPALAMAFGALAAGGFGYLGGQTRATTLLQLEASEHERGRVMALWSVAFLGSRPVASLIDGGVASLLGPRVATIIMAVPAFVVAVPLWIANKRSQ